MNGAARTAWFGTLVGVTAIVMVVAMGLVLRLEDPLSTEVIPAEDPYTHMALVREHLADGNMEPLYESGSLYPPGMHAFLGAAWVFSGAELYEVIRLGPAFLGALGIAGMALLLWRNAGPVAGFVGALAYAVAPEVIFRTTMMSPTALDLAIVPFFLFALVELVQGRLGWSGVAAPMALFLVLAHPWLFGILGITGGLFAFFSLVLPWSRSRAAPMNAAGLAAAVAVVGGGVGIAMWMGAGQATDLPRTIPLKTIGPIVVGLALLPALLVWRMRRLHGRDLPRRDPTRNLFVRAGASLVLAATLVAVTVVAMRGGLPEHVDLPRMLGWPILGLAAFGLIALPFARSPVMHLGASIAAATYPFVMFNPFDSPFWPHRTVVFLAIGLAILAGMTAFLVARAAVALVTRLSRPRILRAFETRPVGTFTAVLPVLLVAASMGTGVYGVTPESYGGWYRLYSECEMDALHDVAAQVDEEPRAIVISGSWQAKTVLAGIATDASRIWFRSDVFLSDDVRADLEAMFDKEDRPVYIIVDRHLERETPGADTSFLGHEPWPLHEAYCAGSGGFAEPRFFVYKMEGAA